MCLTQLASRRNPAVYEGIRAYATERVRVSSGRATISPCLSAPFEGCFHFALPNVSSHAVRSGYVDRAIERLSAVNTARSPISATARRGSAR